MLALCSARSSLAGACGRSVFSLGFIRLLTSDTCQVSLRLWASRRQSSLVAGEGCVWWLVMFPKQDHFILCHPLCPLHSYVPGSKGGV